MCCNIVCMVQFLTHLTLEACQMEISTQSPESRSCLLAIFGNNGLLAEGAAGGLFSEKQGYI